MRKGTLSLLPAGIAAGLLFSIATAAQAQIVPTSITGRLNGGPTVEIGTILPSQAANGAESATFTLDASYRFLMDDALEQEFRWFQVITYDDEPVAWNGSLITAAATANHTGTVVDVPSGGWDYESTTGNNGGDDTIPFYETDTAQNPATMTDWRFPGLAYSALHNSGLGTSSTNDAPGLSGNNHKTLFQTYLCWEDPDYLTTNVVDVIGGFSWGIQTDGSGAKTGIEPSPISFTDIDMPMLTELQGALNRSGFGPGNQWTVIADNNFTVEAVAPEPSSGALCLLIVSGVSPLVARGRRRFAGRCGVWCRA